MPRRASRRTGEIHGAKAQSYAPPPRRSPSAKHCVRRAQERETAAPLGSRRREYRPTREPSAAAILRPSPPRGQCAAVWSGWTTGKWSRRTGCPARGPLATSPWDRRRGVLGPAAASARPPDRHHRGREAASTRVGAPRFSLTPEALKDYVFPAAPRGPAMGYAKSFCLLSWRLCSCSVGRALSVRRRPRAPLRCSPQARHNPSSAGSRSSRVGPRVCTSRIPAQGWSLRTASGIPSVITASNGFRRRRDASAR